MGNELLEPSIWRRYFFWLALQWAVRIVLRNGAVVMKEDWPILMLALVWGFSESFKQLRVDLCKGGGGSNGHVVELFCAVAGMAFQKLLFGTTGRERIEAKELLLTMSDTSKLSLTFLKFPVSELALLLLVDSLLQLLLFQQFTVAMVHNQPSWEDCGTRLILIDLLFMAFPVLLHQLTVGRSEDSEISVKPETVTASYKQHVSDAPSADLPNFHDAMAALFEIPGIISRILENPDIIRTPASTKLGNISKPYEQWLGEEGVALAGHSAKWRSMQKTVLNSGKSVDQQQVLNSTQPQHPISSVQTARCLQESLADELQFEESKIEQRTSEAAFAFLGPQGRLDEQGEGKEHTGIDAAAPLITNKLIRSDEHQYESEILNQRNPLPGDLYRTREDLISFLRETGSQTSKERTGDINLNANREETHHSSRDQCKRKGPLCEEWNSITTASASSRKAVHSVKDGDTGETLDGNDFSKCSPCGGDEEGNKPVRRYSSKLLSVPRDDSLHHQIPHITSDEGSNGLVENSSGVDSTHWMRGSVNANSKLQHKGQAMDVVSSSSDEAEILDPFASPAASRRPPPSVFWTRQGAVGANGTPMMPFRVLGGKSSLSPLDDSNLQMRSRNREASAVQDPLYRQTPCIILRPLEGGEGKVWTQGKGEHVNAGQQQHFFGTPHVSIRELPQTSKMERGVGRKCEGVVSNRAGVGRHLRRK